MNINFNELRDKAYKCACDHGFHEKEISDETYLMLIITEIAEAVNADRKNHHAYLEEFNKIYTVTDFGFIAKFEGYIKDSVEDELADVSIRLLDFAGVRGYNIANINLSDVKIRSCDFCIKCFDLVDIIVTDKDYPELVIENGIRYVFGLASAYNIDLMKHIELKMRYNELRPYKKGKSY